MCARHATQSTDLVERHPSERVGFAREYSFAHKDAGSLTKCLLCPLRRIAALGEAEAGAGFAFAGEQLLHQAALARLQRSDERRVGKEWVCTCRSRWSPCH